MNDCRDAVIFFAPKREFWRVKNKEILDNSSISSASSLFSGLNLRYTDRAMSWLNFYISQRDITLQIITRGKECSKRSRALKLGTVVIKGLLHVYVMGENP